MVKQGSLALEMAPPRIIVTHRRKTSEMKLDTIAEENATVTFSESGSPTVESGSPSIRHQRFGAELSKLAGFSASDLSR